MARNQLITAAVPQWQVERPVTSDEVDLLVDLTDSAAFNAYDRLRRGLDILVAIVGLVLTAPLWLLIAVAIKLESRGPVFYSQWRVGRNRRRGQKPMGYDNVVRLNVRRADLFGQPFRMYKFRTMAVDAEATTGPVWAQHNDPRVTRVGRFLRNTRLDELPQLWNMLKGEMTLIGPRPERPELVTGFMDEIPGYGLRHLVTPGITGLSQVRQGYDRTIDDVRRKVRYDAEYIANRSPVMDITICLSTVLVMIGGDGAR